MQTTTNSARTYLVFLPIVFEPLEVANLGIPWQLAQGHVEEAGAAPTRRVPVKNVLHKRQQRVVQLANGKDQTLPPPRSGLGHGFGLELASGSGLGNLDYGYYKVS